MYRQHENPNTLETQLKRLKEEYRIAVENNADDETLISLHMEIAEMEERTNFAWQDDEYNQC